MLTPNKSSSRVLIWNSSHCADTKQMVKHSPIIFLESNSSEMFLETCWRTSENRLINDFLVENKFPEHDLMAESFGKLSNLCTIDSQRCSGRTVHPEWFRKLEGELRKKNGLLKIFKLRISFRNMLDCEKLRKIVLFIRNVF